MRTIFFASWSLLILFLSCETDKKGTISSILVAKEGSMYLGPDTSTIPHNEEGDLIRYGRELVVGTAKFIGPEGMNGHFTGNKMACTNCHLEAGTRPLAFNFFSTYGLYPQCRSRENAVLTIEQRVNNCVTRPLNGLPLPLDSKEMIAFVSYIKWLGTGVPIGEKVNGTGGGELVFPNRAADPVKGKQIYIAECMKCHGENGEGKMLADNSGYEYPPLWGLKAYQPGSSMYRVIKAARFIKNNMPFGTTWENPKLSDEQALDVSAYVNSSEHIRPKSTGKDYVDFRTKYVDYPYGPYNDPFSEEQHKFGPFQPIIDYRKEKNLYLKY